LMNPRSFRLSQGHLAASVESLAAQHGATIWAVDSPEAIAVALGGALGNSPRWLGVLGGDGTVQEVVTQLGERSGPVPPLLVLGGGRTNLTAMDLGQSGDLLGRLERALKHPVNRLRTAQRTSLRLQCGDQPSEIGFFLAAAGLDDIIRDCHEYRASGPPGPLRSGHLSTGWRLLQLMFMKLTGRLRFPCHKLQLDAGVLGTLEGATRLLVVSSLNYEGILPAPFAERGQGAIRCTAIAADARRFWWRAPRIVAGRFPAAATLDQGYLSGRCEALTVEGLHRFTLDGQEFDMPDNAALRIEPGPQYRFLCP
jgi:hypothetical protein